jgi:hypothetical protein
MHVKMVDGWDGEDEGPPGGFIIWLEHESIHPDP